MFSPVTHRRRRADKASASRGWGAPSRPTLEIDRAVIVRDRQLGRSLGQLAKAYSVSRATVYRVLQEQPQRPLAA